MRSLEEEAGKLSTISKITRGENVDEDNTKRRRVTVTDKRHTTNTCKMKRASTLAKRKNELITCSGVRWSTFSSPVLLFRTSNLHESKTKTNTKQEASKMAAAAYRVADVNITRVC